MSRNIFNLFSVFLILIVITACVCNTDRDSAQTSPEPSSTAKASPENSEKNEDSKSREKDRGDFLVEHVGVTNQRYADLDRDIREAKTLEKAAIKLNGALSLPNDIYLRTKDCDQINAFYDPNDSSVTVCYELMEHFFKVFKSNGETDQIASKKMTEAVQFVFLHEIEEDAADRCSSYVNLEELGEEGVNAVLSAAEAFRIESKGKSPDKQNLADEHLLQEQRFYNALCMLYGSNMRKYSDIVDKGFLPEARAVRCPTEYERPVESWAKILEPWRKQ